MRICHLIKGLGRGGAEMLLPQIARRHLLRHEVLVGYFLPWKNALVGELEAVGAEVRCFGAGGAVGMLRRTPEVARWLQGREVDVVHCHLPLAGVVGRLAGRNLRAPTIYTEHNLQERYHPATRAANRWTWRLQQGVVAVSAEVAESIRRHGLRGVPVEVVHNGIDVERIAAGAAARGRLRAELGIAPEAFVIGTVAVLRRQKRLDLWCEAAARVGRELPQAQFVIAGDGPLRSELESAVDRLGLESRVHLLGLRTDVERCLADFDLFLSSSDFEGLPLAQLEAMAAGVPVVATAVGGVPEAVTDGESGVLVKAGDSAALAAAALALANDRERRLQLARAARRRVREQFSVERMARDLEVLYGRLAG